MTTMIARALSVAVGIFAVVVASMVAMVASTAEPEPEVVPATVHRWDCELDDDWDSAWCSDTMLPRRP